MFGGGTVLLEIICYLSCSEGGSGERLMGPICSHRQCFTISPHYSKLENVKCSQPKLECCCRKNPRSTDGTVVVQ